MAPVNSSPGSRFEGLKEYIAEQLKLGESHIPGLAVGIFQGGQLSFFQGFGVADTEKQTPITADTVFRLASISKIFTTTGLMQLWEQGKFQLDDPVNKYLPKGHILKKHPGWSDVTFRHLLTHRSGIGELPKKSDFLKAPGFGLNVKWPTPIPPLSFLHDKDITPEVAAGNKYAYCNFAFSVLGYLLEVLSGEEFVAYMRKHILEPLGMSHSDFLRTEQMMALEATGYVMKGKSLKDATYWLGIMKPAGMLYSSVGDMAKYGQMLVNGGNCPGGRILKEDTLRMCWTPQYAANPLFMTRHAIGLCFQLFSVGDFQIIEHNGATSGFTSCFSMVPAEKMALMVFGNLDEIFKKDMTLRIKNLILQWLLLDHKPAKESNESTVKPSEISTPSLQAFKGYYSPYPGVLTNTRILQDGMDFSVAVEKGQLTLRGFIGPARKPVILEPTESREVFMATPKKSGAYIRPKQEYVFELDQHGNPTHLCWHFYRLRKMALYQTGKFKILMILLLIIAGIGAGLSSLFF